MTETMAQVLSDLTTSTEFNVGYRNGYEAAVEKACRYFRNVLMQRWGFKKDVATSEADLIKRIMTEE